MNYATEMVCSDLHHSKRGKIRLDIMSIYVFIMSIIVNKLFRQLLFLLDQLVFHGKTPSFQMEFLVLKPFIRFEAETKNKLRKIRIQLKMLLVPVEQGNNFLGIAFHICKHFQECKC